MNNLHFKSKVDWWFSVILWCSIVFITVACLSTDFTSTKLIISLIFVGILCWIWFGTGYTFLEDNKLLITCGPVGGKIDIFKIISVRKVQNSLSSAALSIDRIEIKSSHRLWNSTWYISPQDEDGFIYELRKRNPSIEFLL
jgi:hypothetical protein